MKWIRVIILETFFVCTIFRHSNNNQMQRESFSNKLGSGLYVYMFQFQLFEGGRDADVAHGEHEFECNLLQIGNHICGGFACNRMMAMAMAMISTIGCLYSSTAQEEESSW